MGSSWTRAGEKSQIKSGSLQCLQLLSRQVTWQLPPSSGEEVGGGCLCVWCLQFQCVRQLDFTAEVSPQEYLPMERTDTETDFISLAAGQRNRALWQTFKGTRVRDKHVQPIAPWTMEPLHALMAHLRKGWLSEHMLWPVSEATLVPPAGDIPGSVATEQQTDHWQIPKVEMLLLTVTYITHHFLLPTCPDRRQLQGQLFTRSISSKEGVPGPYCMDIKAHQGPMLSTIPFPTVSSQILRVTRNEAWMQQPTPMTAVPAVQRQTAYCIFFFAMCIYWSIHMLSMEMQASIQCYLASSLN